MFKGLGDKIKGLAGDKMMKYVKGLNFLETKPDVESAFKARAIGAFFFTKSRNQIQVPP